jgi:hypothetical protein
MFQVSGRFWLCAHPAPLAAGFKVVVDDLRPLTAPHLSLS